MDQKCHSLECKNHRKITSGAKILSFVFFLFFIYIIIINFSIITETVTKLKDYEERGKEIATRLCCKHDDMQFELCVQFLFVYVFFQFTKMTYS